MATRTFNALNVQLKELRYEMRGSSSTIERREVTEGGHALFAKTVGLPVTICTRNAYRERFVFKWRSVSAYASFVKRLPTLTVVANWQRCGIKPHPSFERIHAGRQALAFISLWAKAVLPPCAAQLKRCTVL
jgi:hypothetical protein